MFASDEVDGLPFAGSVVLRISIRNIREDVYVDGDVLNNYPVSQTSSGRDLSLVSDSTCAFSFAQLSNPYSLATTNCAVLDLACGTGGWMRRKGPMFLDKEKREVTLTPVLRTGVPRACRRNDLRGTWSLKVNGLAPEPGFSQDELFAGIKLRFVSANDDDLSDGGTHGGKQAGPRPG